MTDGVTDRPADDERLRALMRRYQAGHLDGFDELYALASPAVRRFLRARVADSSRVEDLVQETFLRLHQARRTYDPAYPVRPWLLAIARHTWLMDTRGRSRRPQATDVIEESHALQTSNDADDFAERDEVRRALGELTPAARTPLVLHHVWGYSFAEIAKRMGLTEAAAKLRSSRAMQGLRRALESSRERSKR